MSKWEAQEIINPFGRPQFFVVRKPLTTFAETNTEEDAMQIVREHNTHADLLAACEKALAHLQILHPLTGDEDFAYLEQAIAKAKGEI